MGKPSFLPWLLALTLFLPGCTTELAAVPQEGTVWRFGVDSPKYGRMVSLSIVSDEPDRADIVQTLAAIDPSLDREEVTTALPDPPQLQTRLFEVMPYPRVPRYFRRHWW